MSPPVPRLSRQPVGHSTDTYLCAGERSQLASSRAFNGESRARPVAYRPSSVTSRVELVLAAAALVRLVWPRALCIFNKTIVFLGLLQR